MKNSVVALAILVLGFSFPVLADSEGTANQEISDQIQYIEEESANIPIPFIQWWCYLPNGVELANGIATSYKIHPNGSTTIVAFAGEIKYAFSPPISCMIKEDTQ